MPRVEGTEVNGLYTKICKDPRCRKVFKTRSRNQAFCCPECQKRYYEERSKRRKKYSECEEENRLISRTYKIANEVANIFYPDKVCEVCGCPSTHVHHKDLNPLNNNPTNLMRVCEACHKKIHSELPNINIITTLHECSTLKKENPSVDVLQMWESKFRRN